jgi:hypothetical protein
MARCDEFEVGIACAVERMTQENIVAVLLTQGGRFGNCALIGGRAVRAILCVRCACMSVDYSSVYC